MRTAELTALCREIAPVGGVYVTHMRGYQPAGVMEAMDEVEANRPTNMESPKGSKIILIEFERVPAN